MGLKYIVKKLINCRGSSNFETSLGVTLVLIVAVASAAPMAKDARVQLITAGLEISGVDTTNNDVPETLLGLGLGALGPSGPPSGNSGTRACNPALCQTQILDGGGTSGSITKGIPTPAPDQTPAPQPTAQPGGDPTGGTPQPEDEQLSRSFQPQL